MKAGDTAYLVESNRFVHEVEILRCNGELYIVCFKDNGVGFYFKAYHLLLTSWKTGNTSVDGLLKRCQNPCSTW